MKLKLLLGTILLSLILVAGCSLIKENCSKIENLDDRDECYVNNAKNAKSILVCNNINDKRTLAYCYTLVAEAKKDESICNTLQTDKYWTDICYKKVAEAKKDPSLCAKLPSGTNKDDCYNNIALSASKPELCKDINKESLMLECIYTIALERENPQICAVYMPSYEYFLNKAICYKKIAVKTKDISICDHITVDIIKNNCIEEINEMS